MSDNQIQRSDPEELTYLRRIATGVMIILWVVITGAFTWPIAAVIDAYTDGTDSAYVIGFVIAAVVAFVICRLVFPVEYRTRQAPPTDQDDS